jgi:Protein of unknown function (DUF3574)
MATSLRFLGVLLAVTTVASCAPLPCGPAETRYAAQLLFGQAIGTQGEVSEADWQDFLATAVTPAFPEGLTVTDTQGQWRDAATGALVRERGKIVTLLVEDAVAARPRLEAIADAYKQRFHQDAVGIVVMPACVAFR